MGEITVGCVPQTGPQSPRGPRVLHRFVHPALHVAEILGEEPEHPVPAPAPAGELAAQIVVLPAHPVRPVSRVAQQVGDLGTELGGDALVGVQREHPGVARPGDRHVPLAGDADARAVEHGRSRGPGERRRGVTRAAVHDDDLVGPVQVPHAFVDLMGLVERRDHHRERNPRFAHRLRRSCGPSGAASARTGAPARACARRSPG
jgi:hypothetical protein